MTYWPSQNMLQLGLDFSLHISTLQGQHDSMMMSQYSNGILHLWPFSGSPQGNVAFSFPVCSLRVPALAIKTYFVRNMANKIWYEFILSFFLQQLSLVYCSSKYDTKYPHIYIGIHLSWLQRPIFVPVVSIWYDATWLRLFAYHVSYACIYLFF